ncbi:Putative NAC domain-containing protein 94 [Apostasia shenzhenica]|uniref:NAC domain-containing protein 94 n=1 Tax=Apostasia shenzhenica TaxID=1088818 RepID=A0A2I0AEN5_9ASPA|nr:Putative NAC domain-containing protein 94 [Apostasia shenzhenica]
MAEDRSGFELDLPGFRFHPTEEELLEFYLRGAVSGKKLTFDIIGTLNLYLYDPCDLPALAKIGEREWYFLVPRDRRQANGGRPNRTTEGGFWKATGSDRQIRGAADPRRLIGLKKTLVYYRGRAPRGTKTDWVMNEYRLPAAPNSSCGPNSSMEDIVLCKVYRKATSMKELEQRAAVEEDSRASHGCAASGTSSDQESFQRFVYDEENMSMMEEAEPEAREISTSAVWPEVPLLESSAAKPLPPMAKASRQGPQLPAIQVPIHTSFEWMQDSLISQLRSPWLDQWSPMYANLLNF